MRKSSVRFRHAMNVFASRVCRALLVVSVEKLVRQSPKHRATFFRARSLNDPPHRQRLLAFRLDLDRDLVSLPANTTRTHFENRLDVVQGRLKNFQRLNVLYTLGNNIHRVVKNLLGNTLFALFHHEVRIRVKEGPEV